MQRRNLLSSCEQLVTMGRHMGRHVPHRTADHLHPLTSTSIGTSRPDLSRGAPLKPLNHLRGELRYRSPEHPMNEKMTGWQVTQNKNDKCFGTVSNIAVSQFEPHQNTSVEYQESPGFGSCFFWSYQLVLRNPEPSGTW